MKAEIAGTSPIGIELNAGQKVYWCQCGRSKEQPFCDGAHQGTGIEPVEFTAEKTDKYFFCTCKQTKKSPLCDGSHKNLEAKN